MIPGKMYVNQRYTFSQSLKKKYVLRAFAQMLAEITELWSSGLRSMIMRLILFFPLRILNAIVTISLFQNLAFHTTWRWN